MACICLYQVCSIQTNTCQYMPNTCQYMPILNTNRGKTHRVNGGAIHANTNKYIPIHTKYRSNTYQILANPYLLTLRVLPPFVFRIGMYWHVLACIWYVWACIGLYTTNTIQTNTDHMKKNIGIVLVCINMYWYVWCILYVMVCMRLYWYVLLCIDIYQTQSFVFIGGLHQNSTFGWSEGQTIAHVLM